MAKLDSLCRPYFSTHAETYSGVEPGIGTDLFRYPKYICTMSASMLTLMVEIERRGSMKSGING